MSSRLAEETTTTIAFDVLAAPRRRYLLAHVLERATSRSDRSRESWPVADLATDVATSETDCPIVTDDQHQETHVALVHVHIPRLADLGVLTCTREGDAMRVALADHPLLEADWVRTLLANPAGGSLGDEESLDRTLAALRPPRRRAVCFALASRRGSVSVDDLAAMVAAREHDGEMRLVDVTAEQCRTIATTLEHSHLPALADAGLAEYDATDGRVALATDAPQWRADWLVDGPIDGLDALPRATTDRGDGSIAGDPTGERAGDAGSGCRTVDGAEAVAARGHGIADGADDELFVTVPDAETIQQTCLRRWRDAVDRGVDVYVGSRSPRVRDTVRSAVPGATVCEPQFDWANFPVDQVHHGRVVFADRETVMLVTVDDADAAEAEPRVTAITGDGAENALVLLVREHLGPRLDRLEAGLERRDCDTAADVIRGGDRR